MPNTLMFYSLGMKLGDLNLEGQLGSVNMIYRLKRLLAIHLNDRKNFSDILTGTSWAAGARILAIVLGFVINIIIAKVYGSKVLGTLAFAESTLILVTIFTTMGTNTAILRLIPEHLIKYSPSSAYSIYMKIQKMVLSISIVVCIVFFLFSESIAETILSKKHFAYYLMLIAVFIPFKSLLLYNIQALRGLKLIKEFAAIIVMPHVLNIALLVSFATFVDGKKDIPILSFLLSIAIAAVIGWVVMNISFKKMLQRTDVIHDERISKIISISFPMLLTSTMTYITGQSGVIILIIFRSETEVGFYSVAVKLATATSLILASVNSVIAPKLSELFHTEKIEELFYIAQKSTKLIFFLSLPILMFLLIGGRYILSTFFGTDFVIAYPALAVLLFGQFINSSSGSTMLFMNMTDRQVLMRNIIFISAILQIGLNFILIPQMGMLGAAIAATFTLAFWNLTTIIYLKITYGKTTGYLPKFRLKVGH